MGRRIPRGLSRGIESFPLVRLTGQWKKNIEDREHRSGDSENVATPTFFVRQFGEGPISQMAMCAGRSRIVWPYVPFPDRLFLRAAHSPGSHPPRRTDWSDREGG